MEDKIYENATFIGGHRKTGTTMLVTLLDGHPQLNVFPTDSGFFYAYFPRYESLQYTNKDRINRVINFMYTNLKKDIKDVNKDNEIQLDFDNLNKKFIDKASVSGYTTKNILLAMISAYREIYNTNIADHKRWVEKTTSSEIYAKYIFDWFPHAKFINVIRDPRDNYASLKSGWKSQYKYRDVDDVRWLMHSMIERGKLSMEIAKYNMKRYGDKKYLIVKFEEITTKPKKIMRRISEFLDIRYDNVLLRPTVCGRLWKGNNFDGKSFKYPSSVNVNRWKDRITEDEAKLIEYHFRDIMKYFGYKHAFNINECIDAAVDFYKWYNYVRVVKV